MAYTSHASPVMRSILLNYPRFMGMGQMGRSMRGGGPINHFAGRRRQRGRGFMSFLARAFRNIVQLFKPTIKNLKPLASRVIKSKAVQDLGREAANSALSAGIGFTTDALRGEKLSEAKDVRLEEAKKRIADQLDKSFPTSAPKKKKTVPAKRVIFPAGKNKKRPSRNSHRRDIFDSDSD